MRNPKKRCALIVAAICVGVVSAAAWLYVSPPASVVAALYPYPESWDTIEIGDTPRTVALKCPDIDRSFHDIKGDFAYLGHPAGDWILQVHYDSNGEHVTATHFVLRLGSKTTFRSIHYKIKAVRHTGG